MKRLLLFAVCIPAAFIFTSCKKDTIDKEYLFAKSAFRKETSLVLIESVHISSDSTRGLQTFDSIVDKKINQMLKIGLMLSIVIKTETMSTLQYCVTSWN